MQLSLLIPVYRGGKQWAECWKSVMENADLFDRIYISFNGSELQEKDIETASVHPENVRFIVHSGTMSSVQHGKIMAEFIRKERLEGMLFILCHDDLLNRKGLLELRKNLDSCEVTSGFFGRFSFFRDGNLIEKEQVIIQEISAFEDKCSFLKKMLRCERLTVSSIVIPARVYSKLGNVYELMQCGWYSEILLLLNPGISKIRQIDEDTAFIRIHENSEGSILKEKSPQKQHCITNDTLLTCALAISGCRDFSAKTALSRLILWRFYRDFFFANRMFLKLLFITKYRKIIRTSVVLLLPLLLILAGFREIIASLEDFLISFTRNKLHNFTIP